MHFGAKMRIFMPFLVFGKTAAQQKGYTFWSKSVDFYAFLNFLGKGAALKKSVHFKAKVWISTLFGIVKGVCRVLQSWFAFSFVD